MAVLENLKAVLSDKCSYLFICLFIYLLKFICYLFIIYFWLCWVFVSVRGLSLVVATLHRDARASHYCGVSCCGAQAPDAQAQ